MKLVRSLLIALSVVAPQHLSAQPNAVPVTIIVPYPAGSTADVLPRLAAQILTEETGRVYIIDNKPGATQTIGMRAAASAKPDGNTILFASATSLVMAPAIKKALPYDPIGDFEPITLTNIAPLYLIARRDLPVKSISDLLDLARKQPGKLTYGTGGYGSIAHLAGELLKSRSGIDIVPVPYTGAGPALRDVIGGHIDMTFTGSLQGMTEQVRVLATTGATRTEAMPLIPTVAESGLDGFEVASWFGFLAPAGTSEDIVHAFARDIGRVVTSQEFRQRMESSGNEVEIKTSTPAEFRALIVGQIPLWKSIVKAANILPVD